MDIILMILRIIILTMIFITFRTLRKDYILSKFLEKKAKEILDEKTLEDSEKKK